LTSSVDISTYTVPVDLGNINGTYVGMQIIADATLNADISISLSQSSDGVNFEPLADTTQTMVSGGDSIFVESYDVVLDNLYLVVDVLTATVGELNLFVSTKKKVDSSATVIPNPLPVSGDISIDNQVLNETNIDAFNRLRVSQINSQADLKQIHDNLPLFYDTEVIGGGAVTYNPSGSESILTTSGNGDSAIMQTKQRFNYSSGKSSLILITFREFHTQNGAVKRVGYFNASTTTPFSASLDGFFLYNNRGNISFEIYALGGSSRVVTRANWDDPMDGTGASGIDLALTTDGGNLLMWIDYEWLGVGQIRFGFVYRGNFYVAHKEDYILSDGVYMSSPNHSIRADISHIGSGTGSLRLICATYGTEGEIKNLGKILSDNMGTTHVDANSTSNTYALIGMRLGSSYFDTLVDLLNFTILAITNDSQKWEIWLNPTVAGTFTYGAVANSSIETAKGSGSGNTVTTTSATLLSSGYVSANSAAEFSIESAIRLGSTIAGVGDEIVLCTTPLSSNSDVIASITWREIS